MNNEKYNQIIEEAYNRFCEARKAILMIKPPASEDNLRKYIDWYEQTESKEQFVDKCKNDSEFAIHWRLKIEEIKLNFYKRYTLGGYRPYNIENLVEYEDGLDYITQEQFETFHNKKMDEINIPKKEIKLTYNNETYEFYE